MGIYPNPDLFVCECMILIENCYYTGSVKSFNIELLEYWEFAKTN